MHGNFICLLEGHEPLQGANVFTCGIAASNNSCELKSASLEPSTLGFQVDSERRQRAAQSLCWGAFAAEQHRTDQQHIAVEFKFRFLGFLRKQKYLITQISLAVFFAKGHFLSEPKTNRFA